MNPIRFCSVYILIVFLFPAHSATAQSADEIPLAYISPVPGAKYVMPGTTLAFRHGEAFDPASVSRRILDVIHADGTRMEGELFLTRDSKTLIFKPEKPFSLGERVFVQIHPGLALKSGRKIQPLEFEFTVTEKVIPVDRAFVDANLLGMGSSGLKPASTIPANLPESTDSTLPDGLAAPVIWIQNQPPEGCYFYCPFDPWNIYPDTEPFIAISDAFGTLVYYKKMQTPGYDLKIQPNGMLSYYTYHPEWGHVVMDSAFHYVDKYQMGNGYTYTDFHEFQLFEDGHGFVMTFDPQLIDMSQIVPGGDPEATVQGFVMQELDADKNVIFEWRSWDHFEITDTGPEIDLTSNNIDYVHGNTIEVESDTSLLISCRNMHEVTKIHRNSGEIIWRLGGSQNQFTFLGEDTLRFNRQHDSRRQPDGHITLFDNGTTRPEPQFSSVPEFDVDPETGTATLVKRYRHDPDYFGAVMGNAWHTPDTTLVIGWGSCEPGITEADPEGNVLFEMQFEAFNYRAYRFPWQTTYFSFGSDSLCLEYFETSNQPTAPLVVKNPQNHPVTLTGYSLRFGSPFSLDEGLPQVVPAEDSLVLTVRFIPGNVSETEDILTLNSDIDTDTLVQRIANQIKVTAKQISGQPVGDQRSIKARIYPNPVRDLLVIDLPEEVAGITACIHGITGKKLDEFSLSEGQNRIRLNHLPPGIYTLHLEDREGHTENFKLIRS